MIANNHAKLKHYLNAIRLLENAMNAKTEQDVSQLPNATFSVFQSHQVTNATGLLNQNQNVKNKLPVVSTKTNVNKHAKTQPSKNATTRIIPAKTAK